MIKLDLNDRTESSSTVLCIMAVMGKVNDGVKKGHGSSKKQAGVVQG